MSTAMTEFELLARLRERLPPGGPRLLLGAGDDAAITVPGGATATSVDTLVEGVHFRREHSSLEQVGAKAMGAALSDLAAMGAEAGEAYVVLAVPEDVDGDGCLELIAGLIAKAAETGTAIAGGDLSRSATLAVTVTAVGHAASPELFVSRSGARPGDALVVTGELGGAAAGLLALERPEATAGIEAATARRLLERQLDPVPRLVAGRALAAAGATAMIDISDGLGGDARHLASSSEVNLAISAEKLPVAAGVAEVAEAAGEDPLVLAVAGGEDYELLAAIPAQGLDLERLSEESGVTVTAIGEALAGSGVEIRLPGGRLLEPAGFDQLG